MSARRSWPVMGSQASLVTTDPAAADEAERVASAILADLDKQFSSYRHDSEVSRFDRNEIRTPSADLAEVLAACAWLTEVSDGVFSDHPHGPTEPLDVAGYVKGWAIDRAADALNETGIDAFCLGVGGDWRCQGLSQTGNPWRIAIADPADPLTPRAVVEVLDGAIATSGRYERGDHIALPPGARSTTSDAASFTVVGARLGWADAFATIGFLLGTAGLEWVAGFEGYSAAIVTVDAQMVADTLFPLAEGSAITFPLSGGIDASIRRQAGSSSSSMP